MRAVQFVKWFWGYCGSWARTLTLYVVFCVIPSIASTFWLGPSGLVFILLGVLFGVASWLLYGAAASIWNQFVIECPPEDELIIRKLKGEQKDWFNGFG